MFLINVIDYIMQLDFMVWLFGAFGFLGVNVILQYIIWGGKR